MTSPVQRFPVASGSKCPPWCLSLSWSTDGERIYAGRRNGTVDEFSMSQRQVSQTLTLPKESGRKLFYMFFIMSCHECPLHE